MRELTGEQNRRILVIDDNQSIHSDFKKILCRQDVVVDVAEDEAVLFDGQPQPLIDRHYEIHSAYQGQDGLAKVTEALRNDRPYAVAFVDMRMPPGWDGLETITRLWQEDPKLQIVICTAFSDYAWADITTQVGSFDQLLILKKPFDNVEIAQLAACLTEKWHLARCLELRMDQMDLSIIEGTEKMTQADQETGSLLAAISSLLIGVNEAGIVNRWNTSSEELFGVVTSEALGKPLHDLDIKWADPEAAYQFFNTHNSGAITRRILKIVRDGNMCVLGASMYPVMDNGVNRGFLCLGTDITQQCQLEQQLQQARKLEAVGQLAAGVAHEINTPMQYLGDNLDFLRNKIKKLQPVIDNFETFLEAAEQKGEESKLLTEIRTNLKKLKVKTFIQQVSDSIDDSQEGVQHVSRIVRAMKEFAHPGQDEKTLVDINRALESTIAVSTNEWKYLATIETQFDASIPLVSALAGEVNQVFLNILVNAAHAIGDTNDGGKAGKGTITISTRSTGKYVEVSIADSGAGIADEIKQRIFDPFFTTKEIGKGTGQGLAIAHSVVVQKHGGSLWCDSSPGAGAKFFIQLPVEEPSETGTHHELEPAMVCE